MSHGRLQVMIDLDLLDQIKARAGGEYGRLSALVESLLRKGLGDGG